MPELPEVETIRRGLAPLIEGARIVDVIKRRETLRLPIPNLRECLVNYHITVIKRRAKYLLVGISAPGTLLIHLGMSGRLTIVTEDVRLTPHDHIDIVIDSGQILRYNDPRRFGLMLYSEAPPEQHRLLRDLGPEPLSGEFTISYLRQIALNRRVAIKTLIMDSRVVVGVGNIYAAEALFLAGIHPQMPAGNLTDVMAQNLIVAIQRVLSLAIEQGGTTLKDFKNAAGKLGYFQLSLAVYGRKGMNCLKCRHVLTEIKQSQRSTVFCPGCQVL